MADEKENLFVKENDYHTISIYEKCLTTIFLMATTKTFLSNFKIAHKFFIFLSTENRTLYSKQNFSNINLLHAKFNVLSHKVVLDTLIL